jgi:chemotaxis methyl-accepting protein methylase
VVLARQCGIDLRAYRFDTVARAIEARRRARGAPDLDAYQQVVEADPAEAAFLVQSVLAGVSGFFRDALVFEALAGQVLPRLAARVGTRRPLRVWSAGTATGEEAWSVAALLEQMRSAAGIVDYDVLGTDLDAHSLAFARTARYRGPPPDSSAFVASGPSFEPIAAVRGRVQFARHDLASRYAAPPEAVAASFDLILCRNVLHHFDPRPQEKTLARLLAATSPGGTLVLGRQEDIPVQLHHRARPFAGTDPSARIFACID